MSRARDIANAITVPEFSGNVEIIGTSPELTFETTNSSHYNFQISVQENVSGGLEISSGSADADSSNDTFTPRLVVLNGGNVGIGDTSPSNRLSVVAADGDADNAYVATFQNQEATDDRNYGVLIKAGSTATDSALVVTDHDASNNLFFVKGNGNAFVGGKVGIGTSSPTVPLQLSIGSDNNAIYAQSTDQYCNIGLIDGSGSGKIIMDSGKLLFTTGGDSSTSFTGSSTRVTIDTSGNVGIGSLSPVGILTLQKNQAGSSTAGTGTTLTFNGNANAGNPWEIYRDSGNTGDLVFCQDASGTRSEAMRITLSGGKVGIGAVPARKFDVEGSANDDWISRIYNTNTNGSGTLIRTDATSANDKIALGVYADSAYKMVVRSTGNVGIGTTSPAYKFHQHENSSGANYHLFTNSSTGTTTSDGFRIGIDSNENALVWIRESNSILFATGDTERMRIDSSGNLLVGTTDTSLYNNSGSGEGLSYFPSQFLTVATYQQETAIFNRLSNDGTIVQFRKDGTTVGQIGSQGGDSLTIGNGDTGLLFAAGNDAIHPWNVSSNATRDDAIDLGRSSHRFDDIFATNGTINTSDENEKQDIASMTTAELAVGKRLSTLFKTFRWKSKVTEKADKARTHSGIVAQEVKAAFEAEGLDATKYALFCSDTWTNDDGKEQTRMGVRYPELLSFIASYNESRFIAIEARLAKLEGG